MQAQSSHAQTANHARVWYVQVERQSYGPFDDAALWAFMQEGRVSAQSLVSNSPQSGYRPVSANPGLMQWLAQVPGQTPTQPTPEPQRKPSVFLVMGEIRAGRGMAFLQSLQSLGQVLRVGDTLWILKSRATVDQVRDILGQPLGPTDRLFVLDSFENETAWFNLSPNMDAQIAQMWDIDRS